jgi:hypothetical protein
VQELKPTSLEWSEALDSSVFTRPELKEGWAGFLLAMIVFGLLALSGLRFFSFGFLGDWSAWWIVPALPLLAIGIYGIVRMFNALLTPNSKLLAYKLTNLEFEYELLPTQTSFLQTLIHGQLRATRAGTNIPPSITVSLELNPEHHPNESCYLNSQTTEFKSNSYKFNLEVPRIRTTLSAIHCVLELKYSNQVVFYRVKLEAIPKSAPLEIRYRPDRKAQLEAFATSNADELILRAYNGQSVSAGFLRHSGMPYVDQFSHDEQVAVFTIRFADLMDYLIKTNWFADKIRDTAAVKTNSYFILRESEIYKVIYIEPDFHPFVYSEPDWSTLIHKTSLEREAFEAFLLHSDHSVLLLSGAQKLLEHRSDGDGAQHPQTH